MTPKVFASCRLGYGPTSGYRDLSGPSKDRVSRFFLRQKVGVVAWQFGQRNRRFSGRLSVMSPLMWSISSVS